MRTVTQRLFESGGNAAERGGEIGAERVDRDDDCSSNTGGDQAILNCRGARLFLPEPNKKLRHGAKPLQRIHPSTLPAPR